MIKNGVTDFFFVDKNRATLAIEGEDKIDFLQALTTNNIEKVSKEGIIYTAISVSYTHLTLPTKA